jgi:hypothetical protein
MKICPLILAGAICSRRRPEQWQNQILNGEIAYGEIQFWWKRISSESDPPPDPTLSTMPEEREDNRFCIPPFRLHPEIGVPMSTDF